MAKKVIKKLTINLIIIISLVSLGSGTIFLVSHRTKNTVKENNSLLPQKLLANQIKADLQKDLEEAKKEEKSKRGFGGCSWLKSLGESCSEPRGNEYRLSYFGSDEDKYKERRNARG